MDHKFLCPYLFIFADLDSDDSESGDRNDKMKNPNSIQGGKWQLGFQGEKCRFLVEVVDQVIFASFEFVFLVIQTN